MLIEADSEGEARECAETIGRGEEHSYVSAEGERISWVFKEVFQVYQLDHHPSSGTEIFCRYLKAQVVQDLHLTFD